MKKHYETHVEDTDKLISVDSLIASDKWSANTEDYDI